MTFAPRPPRRRRWHVLRSVLDATEVLPGEFAGDVSARSVPLRFHGSRHISSEQERVGKYVRVIQAQMEAADAHLRICRSTGRTQGCRRPRTHLCHRLCSRQREDAMFWAALGRDGKAADARYCEPFDFLFSSRRFDYWDLAG
jgi:hypothetical protein